MDGVKEKLILKLKLKRWSYVPLQHLGQFHLGNCQSTFWDPRYIKATNIIPNKLIAHFL